MSNSYLTLIEQLSTSVEQLNQILQGDDSTSVNIDGEQKPSVQKKTLDTVNQKVQFLVDSVADIDTTKYANVSAGLSSTVSGQYFSVVGSSDESYLDLYKNEAGSSVFKKSYPSKLKVEQIDEVVSLAPKLVNFETPAGSFEINFKTRTANITNKLNIFIDEGKNISIPIQSVDLSLIPESQHTYAHFFYLINGDTSVKVGTTSVNSPPKNSRIIAVVFLGNVYTLSPPSFKLVDKYGNNLGIVGARKSPTFGAGYTGQFLECNWKTRQVKLNGSFNIMGAGQNVSFSGITLDFDSFETVSAGHSYLALTYERRVSGDADSVSYSGFKLYSWASLSSTSQIIPEHETLICIFTSIGETVHNLAQPPINIPALTSNPLSLTSSGASYSTSLGTVVNISNIKLDMQKKELSVSSASTYISICPNDMKSNRSYATIQPQTFDCSSLNQSYMWTLWYDWRRDKLGASDATQMVPSAYTTIIAYVLGEKMYWCSNGTEQINFINESGLYVDLTKANSTHLFESYRNRILFPRKLFMVEGEELPIFKRSMFAVFEESDLDSMNVFLTPSHNAKMLGGQRHYLGIQNELYVKPEQLGSSGEVAGVRMTHVSEPDSRYNVSTTIKSAPAANADGKTKSMLLIGDSLTEVGMAADFKRKMQLKYNCTINVVGTYASSYTEDIKSEGRGYWQYRSFIGKCNKTGANHTVAPDGATTTTKWQNPFLKLATAQDKIDTPELCFTATSSVKEVSYADDPNQGDYYIFDFGYYLSRGITTPDFITIALSTNDINLQREDYDFDERMFFMKEGLRLMLRSIQAHSPLTKVAVIPAPISSSSSTGYTRWQSENSIWVKECQEICEEYSVDFIACYLHVPRDYSNAWASNVDVSDTMMKKATVTDWVHFDEYGRDMYCNATTAWLVNRI